MFTVTQSDSYFWPVKVSVAVDGGKFKEETFDAQFRRMPTSKTEELFAKLESTELKGLDLLQQVITGWRGVKDENANDVPFSETALSQVLDIPGVAKSLFEAWADSLTGAKRKN